MSDNSDEQADNIIIRNISVNDVPKIIELQKESFPYMAADGVIWHPEHLESHIKIFPDGQFCAELDGKIVASVATAIPSE